MKLIYENDRGKVVMHGGGDGTFNIIEIRGLSLPDSDVNSVYYPNVAGCKVESITPLERSITVSADARDKTGSQISRAINVFSKAGTITIVSGGKIRKISARCVSFEPNKRRGIYVPFAVQFVADDPYFTDVYETKTAVRKREKVLVSPFVLPCAVSIRKVEADIINHGDSEVEPVFEITSTSGAVCPYGIVIRNESKNEEIKINTDVSAGEVITVDVKNRKITSNTRGNLISCLDNETSISRFSFDTGISTTKVIAQDIEGEIYVTCTFNNRYIYAVV